MKTIRNLLITAVLSLYLIGCSNSSNSSSIEDDISETEDYRDGIYCAEVQYYYSNVGTSSSYILLVDIEDNKLVKIHWPNGGWLDSNHFSPPELSDREVSFTSDRGFEYAVHLLGQEDCITSSYAEDEETVIRKKEEEEYEEKVRQEQEESRREQEEMNY